MPLARIVTRFPEDTLAASEYLRSQGYTVEIISPGDFRVTPAALEIKIDKCTPQQALLRVQEAVRIHQSGGSELEPTAAGESVVENRVPIAWDITGRPVEFAGSEDGPERRRTANSFGGAVLSMLDRAWNSVDSGLTRTWRSATRIFREWAQARAEERELEREAKLAREREELQRKGALAEKADAGRREQDQPLREDAIRQGMSRIAAAQETGRAGLQHEAQVAAERERQRVLAEHQTELARQREEQRLAAEREAQEREHARIEAERQATEQERARLQAERQAAEEERVRINALHEQMIAAQLRDRDLKEMPINEPLPAQSHTDTAVTPLRPVPVTPAPLPLEQPVEQPPLRVADRFRPEYGMEWRKAFATAGAAAVLLTAGIIGYANRRPASPLSNSDVIKSQSVQQQAPFGAATVTPPAPTVKPSPATPVTVQRAPVRQTTRTASTSHRSATSRHSARRLRRDSQAEEDDTVADDQVVVRHYSQAVPVAKSRTTAGLKKYSDTN